MIYGAFWKRIGAILVDGAILAVVMMAVSLMIVYGALSSGTREFATMQRILLSVLALFVSTGYMTYGIGSCGQTIGKRVLKLKVIRADGQDVGYGLAFGRAMSFWLYALRFIGGPLLVVSVLMMAMDHQKRSLHDRICSTVVVDLHG